MTSFRRHVQLDPHMQRRGRDHRMDATARAGFDGFRATIDVFRIRPRQAGNDRVLGAARDFRHGLEVAFGGDREASLNDVDAHIVEHLGDFDFFFEGHGRAGALLAVTQRGVENDDAVLAGLRCGCHWDFLWSDAPAFLKGLRRRWGAGDLTNP